MAAFRIAMAVIVAASSLMGQLAAQQSDSVTAALTREWLEQNLRELAPEPPAGQSALIGLTVQGCSSIQSTWEHRVKRGRWRTEVVTAPIPWSRLAVEPASGLGVGGSGYSGDSKGGLARFDVADPWPPGTMLLRIWYPKAQVRRVDQESQLVERSAMVTFPLRDRNDAERVQTELELLGKVCRPT